MLILKIPLIKFVWVHYAYKLNNYFIYKNGSLQKVTCKKGHKLTYNMATTTSKNDCLVMSLYWLLSFNFYRRIIILFLFSLSIFHKILDSETYINFLRNFHVEMLLSVRQQWSHSYCLWFVNIKKKKNHHQNLQMSVRSLEENSRDNCRKLF